MYCICSCVDFINNSYQQPVKRKHLYETDNGTHPYVHIVVLYKPHKNRKPKS